ncbi:MAG: hypothetical protein RXQ74_01610 [Caldivirga sp.]|jgi:Mn-dependent DtxR family transcriptional regulator|uniref:hypothetical protein n=1 Tax=Caldivirga sp. MU80 TaxID=1650354 RepID=UPI000748F70C|nr:hypothetical protein [Caldivirga sp. MU80]KUO83288.1 MAG: hypothetical protein AT709_01695 [Caldivirga sp. MG_3]KUO90023.1 MAG: hypothetical protein AT712_05360 [Caldivirga sp. CIS_19]NAZ28841.1 hypothetical protein [Caldivirga sp.]
MGLVGPEERILVTLFMQSAVNEGKAISVESLAKMINSEVDAVNRVVVTLANQGYVSLKGNLVFLTNKGLMRVLSRFS